MNERSRFIEIDRAGGKIILGLIVILCAAAFIGLCVGITVATAYRVAGWMMGVMGHGNV
jgi:hypothetical protein